MIYASTSALELLACTCPHMSLTHARAHTCLACMHVPTHVSHACTCPHMSRMHARAHTCLSCMHVPTHVSHAPTRALEVHASTPTLELDGQDQHDNVDNISRYIIHYIGSNNLDFVCVCVYVCACMCMCVLKTKY